MKNQVIGDFFEDKKATNVVIKIPMPPTAAAAKTVVSKGRAKYEPGERALVYVFHAIIDTYALNCRANNRIHYTY